MKEIILTAKRDDVLYIDEQGYEHNVYEGYEVHITDAKCVQISEESGENVIEIFYEMGESDVTVPEDMYSLKDWDVFIN